MLNVIDFLERMGKNAHLRHASRKDLGLAMVDAQFDSELQAAILAGDQRRLEVLLGVNNVCCVQCPSISQLYCLLFADEGENDETELQLRQCA